MQVDLYNQKGKKLTKKVTLDKSVFGVRSNDEVILQSIRVYRSNKRVGAHTKVRSEVRGGGKKPWANNKVGRARSSSIRNPIWKGGGVVFGPRNDRNYKFKLSKKMRSLAFRSLFSMKASSTVVVENLANKTFKRPAKEISDFLNKSKVKGKTLFILKTNEPKLVKAINSLDNTKAVNVGAINVLALMDSDNLVIEEAALDSIVSFWGEVANVEKPSQEKEKKENIKKEQKKENKKDYLGSLDIEDSLKKKLSNSGIVSKKDLTGVVEGKIKVKGVGPKSIELIKKVLK